MVTPTPMEHPNATTEVSNLALKSEMGPILRKVASIFFSRVRVEPTTLEKLSSIPPDALVVHVMRQAAWIHFLFLSWFLVAHSLKRLRAVFHIQPFFIRPWRLVATKGPAAQRFGFATEHEGDALYFLQHFKLAESKVTTTQLEPFVELVRDVRQNKRKVYLVPSLFVWDARAKNVRASLTDRIFGSPDAPSILHTVITYLVNYRRAQFRAAQPIALNAFVEQNPSLSDEIIARKVRGALHHHLAKETRAVFGPPQKSTFRTIAETLRDRSLKKVIEEVAHTQNLGIDKVEDMARENLRKIAASRRSYAVTILSTIFTTIFNRIYDGIEVDETGLQNAMRVGSHAPIVLTSSHKSHVDYLVLSYILFNRGYTVPLIAAGANLSFFPLGPLLRRGGAFFLKRSFRDDKLYTACFRAYLKKLVFDGEMIEFFPEGGRSRTGKLLRPKLGMLSWLVDAVLEGAREDLYFVPIAIDYEQVVESSSYSAELLGAEKKSESVTGLLKTSKVLTQNYGRIHLSFEKPISLKALVSQRRITPSSVDEAAKRGLVRALGHHIMYDISRASKATPHALLALALLSNTTRGISSEKLLHRVQLFLRVLRNQNVSESETLKNAHVSLSASGPLKDALSSFVKQGLVNSIQIGDEIIFKLVDPKRLELTFFKNTLVNALAGAALVAQAIRKNAESALLSTISDDALFLSRIFKFEFVYPVGQQFDALFSQTIESLKNLGFITIQNDHVRINPELHDAISALAESISDFAESYWFVMAELSAVNTPFEKKAILNTLKEKGQAAFHSGAVFRSEALAKTNWENALEYAVDQSLVVSKDSKFVAASVLLKRTAARLRTFIDAS